MKCNHWKLCLAGLALCAALAGCHAGSQPSALTGTEAEPTPSPTPAPTPYCMDDTAFSQCQFSLEPGLYTESQVLTVSGAEELELYYTINGLDPVELYEMEPNYVGQRAENGEIPLERGVSNVRVRLVDPETHTIGPLMEGTYRVKIPFDSTSTLVDEDSSHEYIIYKYFLMRRNIQTGEKETVYIPSDGSVNHLNLFIKYTTWAEYEGEYGYTQYSMMPEAAWEWQEKKDQMVEVTCISLNHRMGPGASETVAVDALNGTLQEWQTIGIPTSSYHVGNGAWCLGYGQAYWFDDMLQPAATEEVALWCTLLTDEIAIRNTVNEDQTLWTIEARDPDGGNQRLLWESDQDVFLDAIIADKLLYHVWEEEEPVHMVYDLTTGEHRENTFVPRGTELLGYTSQGYYMEDRENPILFDYKEL
ncbi:MAG: hypothetical protein MSB10_05630 [Clostridiales bacterium]|uniref:hypothetical protein n=1 Tax=Flavonifractor porci TaxID=3133422 RepID=UPI00309CE507|nr:hypothetical protein [Clostridiales bacterium]